MIEYVIYTEEADEDVVSHYHWYEDREPGLGEDFLRCVEACVLGIQRNPRLYPLVVDGFGERWFGASLSRFSTNSLKIPSSSIPSFIRRRIHRSGVHGWNRA